MTPPPSIDRYSGDTPPDLARLAVAATSEGFSFVTRTIEEWTDGTNRFDRPGECFIIAEVDAITVGMCGLNVDPYLDDPAVGRLRHLYVQPEYRRHGLGTRLVDACVESGHPFAVIRLRTFDTDADRFYQATGWESIDDPSATHVRYRTG